METVELNEKLLIKIAGWDVIKQARAALAADKVLGAEWKPPLLTGIYSEGGRTLKAGLLLRDAINVENLCPCRQSRDWGTICHHSVAIGLKIFAPPPQENPVLRKTSVTPGTTSPPGATAPAANIVRLTRAQADDAATVLKLHVVLPPNFLAAARGSGATVAFEAEWNGRRAPLSAVPRDGRYTLEQTDAAVLDFAETLARTGPPAMLPLRQADAARLLDLLVHHPRATVGRSKPFVLRADPVRLRVRAELKSSGDIQLQLDGAGGLDVLAGENSLWSANAAGEFQPLRLPAPLMGLLAGSLVVRRAEVPQFLSQSWPLLNALADVDANFDADDFEFTEAEPEFSLHLAGGLAMLQATLRCRYGGREVALSASPPDALWLFDPANPRRFAARNFQAEKDAVRRLERAGFSVPDAKGVRHLKGQREVLSFFAHEFPAIEQAWKVTLEERLERSATENLERVTPQFRVTSSGTDWFDMSIEYRTASGEVLGAADVQALLRSGGVRARDGSRRQLVMDTGAVEALEEILVDAAPKQGGGRHRFAANQAAFLDGALREHGWQAEFGATKSPPPAVLLSRDNLPVPPLGALETVLRPYQKRGVAWLHFLRENGLGGVLADEMGLGKTLQILALLQTRNGERGARKETATDGPAAVPRSEFRAPSLVVCPTSLVPNWAAEARKFTPQLRTLALEGVSRHEQFARIAESDLVITSYALLRRDIETHRGIEYDTVILDEAQHIKNRDTQNAQSVKSLRSRHRLVLTGTPLENSVLDLWSLFDFLMPGYLGGAAEFRERYELPLTTAGAGGTTAARARLSHRVRPYILRRTKREVAPDLPPKIEQVSLCEMTPKQSALYRQLLDARRSEVLASVKSQGVARSRMLILTTLLRLRQACCDPRLLGVDDAPSAKVELFGELLEEVLDGGHRVLVFSQFTTMLDLLAAELNRLGLKHCLLTGDTRNRFEVVEKFQTDAAIPVFLISLKAGGTGLNLTGADTVMHFDPWWNPAVEAQATDRAHRIGQRRVVTSYKLITRGTVEEKILQLQEKKRALLGGVMGDEETLLNQIDAAELESLLET